MSVWLSVKNCKTHRNDAASECVRQPALSPIETIFAAVDVAFPETNLCPSHTQ